jgi:1,4-dihydroxy-2-naphthoate polyprenyltransferase
VNATSSAPLEPTALSQGLAREGERGVRAWVRALRLPAAFAALWPLVLGMVLAMPLADGLATWLWLPALLGAFLLHTGASLVNDLGDYERGLDREGEPGGSGVLPSRLLAPRQVARAAWTALGLAALCGTSLLLGRGLPMMALGAAFLLGSWGYTAGPGFKYLGLGDLFVFLLEGPLLALAGYVVVSGQVAWDPVLAAIPLGLLSTAALHANNLRKRKGDLEGGVSTVALWLGVRGSLRYFLALVFGAFACLGFLTGGGLLPRLSLLTLLLLPLVVIAFRALVEAVQRRAGGERVAWALLVMRLGFGLSLCLAALGRGGGPWQR